MTQTVEAIYDGKVIRPDSALSLKPNTRVKVIVEEITNNKSKEPRQGFLATARSLNLDGPADWSEQVDHYLYGVEKKKHD